MTPDLLKRLIADQQEEGLPSPYFHRIAEKKLTILSKNKEIIILKGIRRCGKSVLLQLIRKKNKESAYYFNLEDERLIAFTVNDFQLLQEVFIELYGIQKTYYFDEIQNIPNWERFVRRLYNDNNKIYITGSNASLFSKDLGTHLTGRYISMDVYPLSFFEFVLKQDPKLVSEQITSTRQLGQIKKLFNHYCHVGGFPEYIKYENNDYMHSLYESIIYRDIISRYKISNSKPLRELVYYLVSNCSKEITYNALRKLLQLGSATTVSDYCSYLEDSYLCFFVNRYDESVKKQMQSPKKVYVIDHALAKFIGFHFSEDQGRMLENIVFIELKRQGFDVYYHRGTKECDFLVRKNNQIVYAIQVCQQFSSEKVKQREQSGLLEALERHSLPIGYVLTEREEETVSLNYHNKRYQIITIPIWKWLLEFEK
ncbi:MAG: ATP-binding protein [Gammaproteobacteria bacterium RIFCSPHIGHO2_12_FULL_37_34]|nr:MAG: ATP-binding protein [Gammaproteobacteria bacterium RIFCSPHIGHO2_12_FULL_37_34]